MATLRLQLLGQPLVWRDEQPVRFKTRKTLAAVAYLAAEGGLPSREQLAALLWPDLDLADAQEPAPGNAVAGGILHLPLAGSAPPLASNGPARA